MSFFSTEGVILRSRDYRERDRLLMLFTRDRGRMTLIATGARRPGSRFGAALELGSVIVFDGYQREPDQLGRLSAGRVQLALELPRSDLRAYAHLNILLELVDRLAEWSESAPVFHALVTELKTLNRGAANPATLLRFFLRLLRHVGHEPEMDHCLICRSDLPDARAFSISDGGVVCRTCRPQALLLAVATVRALRQKTATQEGVWQALTILQEFVGHQLDVGLRAWPFYCQQWRKDLKRKKVC